ncbi:AEC family transporter [Marinobacteraceae bacterium S3BR75-40.1]
MAVATALLVKLIPLYLLIVLGWLAGRFVGARGEHIAPLMMYFVTPAVVFSGVMSAPLTPQVLLLPLLVWATCVVMSLVFLKLGKGLLGDNRANILALAVGTGNTGYFGIPVALLLFGEEGLGLYIICMLGTTLFENSVGFYIAARGRYGARECFARVLRLPSLYAFAAAAILNTNGIAMPEAVAPFFDNMFGAYSTFGMMIIGMSIGRLSGLAGDWRFTGATGVGRFVAWPLLVLTLWSLDVAGPRIYEEAVYQSLFLISLTPVAANTVVIATLVGYPPRQVAGTTLLSTLFALVYIPLMVSIFLGG